MDSGGTGTQANIPAYQVAGKTGTVHKVGREGYADDRYISLFVGFAPANDPRVVAVVVIHEPSNGQYFGGEVAAPVFASLVERSLRLLQVPPPSAGQTGLQSSRQISHLQTRKQQAAKSTAAQLPREPMT